MMKAKNIFALAVLFCSAMATAQYQPSTVRPVATSPQGNSCSAGSPVQYVTSGANAGQWCTCNGSTYQCSAPLPGVTSDGNSGVNVAGNVTVGTRVMVSIACDGTTDNLALVNQMLLRYAEVDTMRNGVSSCGISGPIVLHSNNTLVLEGDMKFSFLPSVTSGPMLENASVTPQRTVSDGAIMSGSNVLISASANFTSSDIGRMAAVMSAGPLVNGTQRLLFGQIGAVTNSTTAQLVVPYSVTIATPAGSPLNASHTVSGVTVKIYTRDSNITVKGGSWDRGGVAGDACATPADGSGNGCGATRFHSLLFRHIDGITISDLSISSSGGKYSIDCGDCTNENVQRIRLSTNSDGVSTAGPAKNVVIRDITGTTGDDSISILPADSPYLEDVRGNITDYLAESIHTSPDGPGCTSHACSVVDLVGGQGLYEDNITIHNVRIHDGYGQAVEIRHDLNLGTTDARHVTIDDIGADSTSHSVYPVFLYPDAGRDISVFGVSSDSTSTAALVYVSAPSGVGAVNIENLTVFASLPSALATTASTGSLFLADAGTIQNLHVTGTLSPTSNINSPVYFNGATIGRARVDVQAYMQNATANIGLVAVYAGSIGDLSVDADYGESASTVGGSVVAIDGGTVSNLDIHDTHANFAAGDNGSMILSVNSGVLGRAAVSNSIQNNGRAFIFTNTGSTVGPITVANTQVNGPYYAFRFYSNADLTLNGFVGGSFAGAGIYANGATVTVRGSGVDNRTGWAGFARNNSEVLHCINSDYPADISLLTKAMGDRCYNTNSSLGTLGVAGPVISDGSVWKLATDFTKTY